jgi:lipopolysaccharide export system permease protein
MYIDLDGLGLDRNNEDMFKNGFEMLNIMQLQYAIDSLDKTLNKRKGVIGYNFLDYSLFKGKKRTEDPEKKSQTTVNKEFSESVKNNRLLPLNNAKQIDTVEANKIAAPVYASSGVFINLDSLFNSLSAIKKNKTIDFALNYSRSAKSYIEMTSNEVQGKSRWIGRHEIEWHRKFTVGFACIVLFFVGAPLGAIIRKGGFGTPVVLAVFVFLMYYIVSITFEKMARELVLSAFVGMWISSLIMLPFGVFLTIRAANDSLIVSAEQYERFMQKLKVGRKRKVKQ